MTMIKKPSELEVSQSIKVLIYGEPGSGKTTLALSTPSPLHLDFDGGVHRIKPQHQCDTVQVRSWEDIDSVLKEDLSKYKSLVIDTAGKLLDFMSMKIIKDDPKMGRNGNLTLQGYGVRKMKFTNFVKSVSLMGKNLVFVAHDREERDGDNKIIRPEIGGSSGGDLIKEIDLVGYMAMLGKKRTISFNPCEKFYGKNTCELDDVIDVIDVSKAPNNQLTKIFDQYRLSLEKRIEMVAEYEMLMTTIQEVVSQVTEKNINDVKKDIANLIHIWDSLLQGGVLLNAKAKELGMKFDKAKDSYIKL